MQLPKHPVAFVHVDMDNLWAIADCYGIAANEGMANYVYEDALPRFRRVFDELGIRATFFVNGRDLEIPGNCDALRQLAAGGHCLANHSYSHRLDFRNLGELEIEQEVLKTHRLLESGCNVVPRGFRAPGYGFSMPLARVLGRMGYGYDSSVMPSPYGFLFRYLDARLRRQGAEKPTKGKTQYPRMREALLPIAPYPIMLPSVDGGSARDSILEIPVAASPLLRLPFQAGVCLSLGRWYFERNLDAYRRRPTLPLVFLMHGADLTDFRAAGIPFFTRSRWFSKEIDEKVSAVIYCISKIKAAHEVERVEAWVALRKRPVGYP